LLTFGRQLENEINKEILNLVSNRKKQDVSQFDLDRLDSRIEKRRWILQDQQSKTVKVTHRDEISPDRKSTLPEIKTKRVMIK
jgi:hypothetical protein